MQTPFGGGKTHALLALYHLFSAPQRVLALPGVREAVGDLVIPTNTRVVAFDGMLYGADPIEKPDGFSSVASLWGELAYQVDGDLFFTHLQDSDSRGEGPGMLI